MKVELTTSVDERHFGREVLGTRIVRSVIVWRSEDVWTEPSVRFISASMHHFDGEFTSLSGERI